MLDKIGWHSSKKMYASFGLMLCCWIFLLGTDDPTFNKVAVILALAGFFSINLAIHREPINLMKKSPIDVWVTIAFLCASGAFFAIFFSRAL